MNQAAVPTFSIDKIYLKDLSVEVPNAPEVFMETEAPTVEVNMAEPLPEAEPEAPDAQMLDDASATGMTARADRGNDDEAPANRE